MRPIVVALVGMSVGLLLVGVASGTPLRHAIQVSPIVLALFFVAWRPRWAAFVTLPVFAFWLLIMIGIWLFLLGLPSFVSGHFLRSEIVLSTFIGVSALMGLCSVLFRAHEGPGWARGGLAFLLFLGLVILGFWMSIQPGIARS
jgi:hypothetical protein